MAGLRSIVLHRTDVSTLSLNMFVCSWSFGSFARALESGLGCENSFDCSELND